MVRDFCYTVIMMIDDQVILSTNTFINSFENVDNILRVLNYGAPIVLATLILIYIFLSKKYQTIIVFAFTGACAYLLSRFIGFLYFRPRPFVSLEIDPIITMTPFSKSFPSSHALVSVALAVLLFSYHRRLGIWAIFVAVLICICRVLVGVHYPSDVLVGAALGVVVSKLIRRFE